MKNIFLTTMAMVLLPSVLPAQNKQTPVAAKVDSTAALIGYPEVSQLVMLPSTINTSSVEINPVISPEGDFIYFSRKHHSGNSFGTRDPEDIWFSTSPQKNGQWSQAQNAGKSINNAGPNYISQIIPATAKGEKTIMIIGNDYQKRNKKGTILRYVESSQGFKGPWGKPKPIKISKIQGFKEATECFLTQDKKLLFISIEQKGGFGQQDIYVCAASQKENFTFEAPINLGPEINTPGDDRSPHYVVSESILFYSTDGLNDSYGGHDVYVSKKIGEKANDWTKWSIPHNLGAPINTPQDELDFSVKEEGKTDIVYFSRGIMPEDFNIYSAKIEFSMSQSVAILGKLVDENAKPLEGFLSLTNKTNGKLEAKIVSDPVTGAFVFKAPRGFEYEISATVLGKTTEQPIELDLTQPTKSRYENQILQIKMDDAQLIASEGAKSPVITEKTAVLPTNSTEPELSQKTILFETARARISAEYLEELDRMVTLLNEQSMARIHISGHADARGSEAYNLGLSRRRAEAIARYLNKKGIADGQISLSYFGENKPIDPGSSEEAYRKNRRAEISTSDDHLYMVTFGFDQSQIPSVYHRLLNDIAAHLLSNDTPVNIRIDGYTDRIGTDAYNLELSKQRAESVSEYLISKGIDKNNINIGFFGEQNIIDEKNNRRNRRVEIRINT